MAYSKRLDETNTRVRDTEAARPVSPENRQPNQLQLVLAAGRVTSNLNRVADFKESVTHIVHSTKNTIATDNRNPKQSGFAVELAAAIR